MATEPMVKEAVMKKLLFMFMLLMFWGCGSPSLSVDERVLLAAGKNNPTHRIYVCKPKGLQFRTGIVYRGRDGRLWGDAFYEDEFAAMSLSTNRLVREVAMMIQKCDDTTFEIRPAEAGAPNRPGAD